MSPISQIALILTLAIIAEITAHRVKFPAIIFLLLLGYLAGDWLKLIQPDALLGPLLFPIINVIVALILFCSGLNLRLNAISGFRTLTFNLATVGALTSWALISLAANYFLHLDLKLSLLVGATLVATGPSVIEPILKYAHAKEPLPSILRWEASLLEPLGGILAVLVFKTIHFDFNEESSAFIFTGIFYTIIIGLSIGTVSAYFLRFLLQKFVAPDDLINLLIFGSVIVTFELANYYHTASGLLAVTTMGIFLSNSMEEKVRKHILESSGLNTLLISALFIILSARLNTADLVSAATLETLGFIMIVVLVIRPFSVWLSAIGSGLKFKQVLYLGLISPKGIVGASLASIFVVRLSDSYSSAAGLIMPYILLTVVTTIIFYSIFNKFFARILNVSLPKTKAFLIIGANPLALKIAQLLKAQNLDCLLVDTNPRNVYSAIKLGLKALHANALGDLSQQLEPGTEFGKLLALTPNTEINTLAALKHRKKLGQANVYQLSPPKRDKAIPEDVELHGRILFDQDASYYFIQDILAEGLEPQTIFIDGENAYKELQSKYPGKFVPLFFIDPEGQVDVVSVDSTRHPKIGWKIIALFPDTNTMPD
jgi:NhaP-type Na+/H+ or K+/H+ antiporter